MEKFTAKRYAIPSIDRIEKNGNYRFIKSKKYKVITESKTSFVVKSESGYECICLKGKKQCAHLLFIGDWKLINE